MSVVDTMHSKRITDEVRLAHQDLEYFYMEAKRNKKLAKWASGLLGIDKQEYFMELITEDLTKAGPKPVVERIMKDFNNAGLHIKETEVWSKVQSFEQKVLQRMLEDQAMRTIAKVKASQQNHKIPHKKSKKGKS